MSNGFAVKNHRGIEITYGYKIIEGENYAHFDLPERVDLRDVMETTNSSNSRPLLRGGHRKLVGPLQSELLEQACREIDQYLDG